MYESEINSRELADLDQELFDKLFGKGIVTTVTELKEKIKADSLLKRIPVIVLTSSKADKDIIESYNLHANCYIVKPVDAVKFMSVVQQVENFWVDIVCLPPTKE